MKRQIKRVIRYVGWVCSLLGIALVVLGLIMYFNGPNKDGAVLWKYEDNVTKRAPPHEFVDQSYRLSFPEAPFLILQVQTNASIIVEEGQGIKAYFMNETQYSQLKNDTGFTKEIEELIVNPDNISFEPRSNVTYYIVLTNIDNETATSSINISTFYTFRVFDFDNAFEGVMIALIGGVMFTISFALENPIDKLIRKVLRLPIFPGVKNYLSEKEPSTIIPWSMLGILTLMLLFVLVPLLNQTSNSSFPPPLIPLMQDTVIRIGLLYFFVFLLFFVLYIVVVSFVFNVFRNFLYWFFGVRYHREYNVKLAERSFKLWLKELASPSSLLVYFVIAISSLGMYQYSKNDWILLIAVTVPLTLLLVYNISISYRKARFDERELEQIRFSDYVSIVTAILGGGLFVLSLYLGFDLFISGIYAETLGSSVLSSAPQMSEVSLGFLSNITGTFSAIKGGFIILLEGVFVGAFSLFLFLGYLHNLDKTHEAKAKIFLKEIGIFCLTFISVQLILLITQQSFSVATVTSIFVSLVTSFLSFFMRTSWKHIAVAPRLCPRCHKDLSGSPEGGLFCPYCGEVLDLRKK